MVETTNRRDLRVPCPAREQGGCRVDQAGIDADDFAGAVRHHADGAASHRQNHDLAALLAMRIARQSQQRTQRHQWQQTLAQRHHAQHGRLGTRNFRHMIRERNDLTHAVEREGVFLRSQVEADQRHLLLRFGSSGARCRGRNRKLGCGTRTGETEAGELVAKQSLRIQYLDRAVAFVAFDNPIQEMRIDGARSGISLIEVMRREG